MKTFLLSTFLLMLPLLSKSQDIYPLKNQLKICLIVDFSQTKEINDLPIKFYEKMPQVLTTWSNNLIDAFNAECAILYTSSIQKNEGEKYDLIYYVKNVDSDGETNGEVFLIEHATGNIIYHKDIDADGGSGRGFEKKWKTSGKRIAKKLTKFTYKLAGYHPSQN